MIALGGVLFLSIFGRIISSPVNYDEITAMENPDLFEGDILGIDNDDDRGGVLENYRKWPNGRIPFQLDPAIKKNEDKISHAMKQIEEHTCIRFVSKEDTDNVYLNIFPGRGCYSRVGKTMGEQPLSLGAGCYSHGAITHELGHAIGLFHEHSRPDRDDYIQVHFENIREGYADQFKKMKKKELDMINEFDYDSIMLYSETIFSKDHANLKTMTSLKEGVTLEDLYTKPGLSASDIFRIKKMYSCS